MEVPGANNEKIIRSSRERYLYPIRKPDELERWPATSLTLKYRTGDRPRYLPDAVQYSADRPTADATAVTGVEDEAKTW